MLTDFKQQSQNFKSILKQKLKLFINSAIAPLNVKFDEEI